MSGDPVDSSGQYNNIFERCIIIQNYIYMIYMFALGLLFMPGYIKPHLNLFKYDISVVIFLLINLK